MKNTCKDKVTYIFVGKPIIAKKFCLHSAPIGWSRYDNLQKKLEENKSFRQKFTKSEIKKIRGIRK